MLVVVIFMEFTRAELLFGDNLTHIQNKTILVIGAGGVGSYVIESLARLGVHHIIIVDGDVIDVSNINRQIFALHSTIGLPKVVVAKNRISDISSSIKVDTIYKVLSESDVDDIITSDIDYVVDACDTVSVKKAIIRTCIRKNVKFISSMGTGNKIDPTKLKVMDVRKTAYDPIAKIIRKMVRDERIKSKVMVIASTESPIKHEGTTIASCSFVPSVAGLLCTSYIVNDILGDRDE